jgi:Holliday junction resolvase-like predicted endonuclease
MNDKQYKRVELVKRKLKVAKINLGKAGEHFVAAKLLLNGFNIFQGAIDDGIDLVARKRKKFYFFQVKTCQDVDYDSGKFMAKINLDTFLKFPKTQSFLVLVLHFLGANASIDSMGDPNRYEQEFIVLPSAKLDEILNKKNGNAVVYLFYSPLMQGDNQWIVKLKYSGTEYILDDFLFDSFWQVEI